MIILNLHYNKRVTDRVTCRKIAKVHTNNCKNMIFKILQKVIEDCVYVDKLLLVVMIDDADTCFIELAFKRFP